MFGPSLRMIGQCIPELLIGNIVDTFDPGDLDLWHSDPKINRVLLLPRASVWTKFEEGRSRHSRVIDRKRKGYRWTNRQTDLPTNMYKAICPLFFEGGHKNNSKVLIFIGLH